MQGDYIGIQYDRAHLNQSYQFNLLPFDSPLATLDLIVLFLNISLISIIIGVFIYRTSKMPKQRELILQRPQKNNIFPFFSPIKSQRKGKNREGTNKEVKDNQIQLICQKCKYITQINQKNLITNY